MGMLLLVLPLPFSLLFPLSFPLFFLPPAVFEVREDVLHLRLWKSVDILLILVGDLNVFVADPLRDVDICLFFIKVALAVLVDVRKRLSQLQAISGKTASNETFPDVVSQADFGANVVISWRLLGQ
jgi:hypothetical protein